MTKEEWLARCSTAYDMGLAKIETLVLANSWVDFTMRYEGGQMWMVNNFLQQESERTAGFTQTLAMDFAGYKCVELMALLAHPCQKCATDAKAWHARWGFCPHRKEKDEQGSKTRRTRTAVKHKNNR